MNLTQQSTLLSDLDRLMQKDPAEFTALDTFGLESLFRYCNEGAETDSQRLVCSLIIKAFNRRVNSEAIREHIYLNKSETPQIELFRILIEQFPFVQYSQLTVNNAILEQMRGHREVTLVDIGLGQGVQMMQLLNMARQLPELEHVYLIGIEPFADALQAAGAQFEAMAQTLPFQLHFTPVCEFAEHIDFATFGRLVHPVIVNASLALHHIPSRHDRKRTLAKINNLKPAAFFLIEPNVDHMEPNVFLRYKNCYGHYYNLFRVIDRLDIAQEDRNALKLFFGREISDVLGNTESDRFERHEPAVSWLRQLAETGFENHPGRLQCPVTEACGVQIKQHKEGFLGFTYDTETILAVLSVSC